MFHWGFQFYHLFHMHRGSRQSYLLRRGIQSFEHGGYTTSACADIEQTITSIKLVVIFSMKLVCSTSVRPARNFKIQDSGIFY
eukprot:SAG11_NODE_1276_length_5324_cov_2.528421_1_plen_82_part_10